MTEHGHTSKAKVLVVDDDPRNIGVLEEILEDFTVASVRSGDEAIQKLASFAPDVILMDITMPDMDGYEACRRIRALKSSQFTKIIFVSGKAYLKDRLQGYAAGGDDYLIKPFDGDELLAKLNVFLRLKHVEEVLKIKSDFLDLINHETRTPLTGILTISEMLACEAANAGSEIASLAGSIHACGQRLMTFLEKTILLCTLKGTTTLEPSPCPMDSILDSAVGSVAEAAAQRNVRIVKQTEPCVIQGDLVLLTRAVTNVLDNAVRFSPDGASVEVEGAFVSTDEACVLHIRDHGKGIKPDQHESIFSEFAIQDVAHHTEGLGLSLAIARRVVELHGGTLRVESEEGKGATFRFTLPAVAHAAASSEPQLLGSSTR